MNLGQDAEAALNGLNHQLEAADLKLLDSETTEKFGEYLALILKWNARMNLTAIRDPKEIINRHFVESITCAQALPAGIATLLDLGSGAGLPGIPIALCRPEIKITLAESQSKKAAFLQEAVRSLKLSTRVFAGRAESLNEQFDCVTLRAVDRMEQAIAAASKLVRSRGLLAVFTTNADLVIPGDAGNSWQQSHSAPMVGSEQRLLVLFSKTEA